MMFIYPSILRSNLARLGLAALLVLLSFYIQSTVVEAQAQGGAPVLQIPDNTQFFITPQYPGPNELVKIRIENYNANLDTKEITWSLDGKVQKKGVGEKTFEFTTKGLGSVSTVSISGSGISNQVQIRPTGLDLAWQTKTYVPPFYKGKALYTYQSAVEIVAMPSFVNNSGTTIDPKNLVYKWTRNDDAMANASGYGKNVLATSGGVLAKPLYVSVEVSSTDGSLRATKSIALSGTQSKILLYEDHPLYGIQYSMAIPQQFSLQDKEVSLSLAPYFLDIRRKDDPLLSYTWKVNGQTITNQDRPDILVLRAPDNGSGEANLDVKLQKSNQTLQAGAFSTRIQFGANEQ